MSKLFIGLNDNKNKIQKQQRNKEIDIIKGFACMSVIYIHCSFPGFVGKCIIAINAYAVPFFFFISGYYFLNSNLEIKNNKIIMKVKHLLILLRKISLFYCIFCILSNKLKNKSWNIKKFTKKLINKQNIIKFIFLNKPFLYLHIWFILALLYCYLFLLLLRILCSGIISNSFF